MAREQIASYYRQLLGREPDQGGLDAWTNAVNAGHMTLAGAAGGIARSAEANNRRSQQAQNTQNLTTERNQYYAQSNNYKNQIGGYQSQIADYQNQIGGYESKLGEFQNKIGGLEGELGNYRAQVTGLTNQYNTALGERDSWMNKSNEFMKSASDWEDKFGEKSEEYERARGEANMYRDQAVGQQLRALRSGSTSGGSNATSGGNASLQGGRGGVQRYDDNSVDIDKNIQAESGALSNKGAAVQKIQSSNRRQSASGSGSRPARSGGSGSYYAGRFG